MTDVVWPNADLQRHLAGGGPKRILALDGGGVRGLLTLGILHRVETVLAQQSGRGEQFVLSDYFDLIAGTSTGAIIATLLGLGKRVADVKTFYDDFAPQVFAKAQALGARVPKFNEAAFETLLTQEFGDEKLGTSRLKTGLLICAKRMDTGSQWAISNDPRSKYYNAPGSRSLPNCQYELRMLIRASTAAPYYFAPVRVPIATDPNYPPEVGMFVDGGVGGDNNPSLQALKSATLPGYRMNWPTGENNLLMLSVGTGWRRPMLDIDAYQRMWNWEKSAAALSGMIQDSVQHNIVTLQALSRPRKPWYINRELAAMENQRLVSEPLLTYQRIDASMEDADVARLLALQGKEKKNLSKIVAGLKQIDNASERNRRYLYALGLAASEAKNPGKDGIEPSDFPDQFRI